MGPIPSGNYTADMEKLVKYSGMDRLITFAKDGDFGRFWIPLDPSSKKQMHGRTSVGMHGGCLPGSAGCIDVGDNDREILKKFDNSKGKIPLIVE